jgi:hypothetical protein
MKSNASAVAALLLLAGCGGDRTLAHAAPELAGPPPGSIAAQSWAPRAPTAPARGASGLAEAPAVAGDTQTAPGASYPVPGSAPTAAPRIDYAPPPPQESAADPAASAAGPRGSSQRVPGEQRYDEIGYAGVGVSDGSVTGVHRSLPADTLLEVTSLENGRTVLVLITATDPAAGNPIELSAGAARALGHDGVGAVPVRMRRGTAGPGDLLALRSGRPAAARPDTPPVLLNALRKHLGQPSAVGERPAYTPAAVTRPTQPVPAPRPARPAATGGFFVQIAALSNARNAEALAQRTGGFVKQGGGLYRVQLGPFATRREADAARGGAARAGYEDARVLAVN